MPNDELEQAMQELSVCRKRVAELQRKTAGEKVKDYPLKDRDGKDVSLSELFGDKNDLIVIHNMGSGCRYCTLWADGFNGVYQHLENRAGFVVVSHDRPSVMAEFADSRGWNFRILSNDGGDFTRDMGYEKEDGSPWPGVSTFHRDQAGNITRVAHAPFGPGDEYCAVWHLFDMLEAGADGWEPRYEYN